MFLRPNIEKNLQLQKNDILFGSKTIIYLTLGLHKGRPSYRRSLQPQKKKTKQEISKFFPFFVGNFCPPGSGSDTDLDSESESGYGSTDLIESGSNPNPDPIRNQSETDY